ncbi:MAG: UMP kinase [Candidatus Thermoplasmatota archaeon]|nr:UMP kinase [Candidatus Thermoplasmatota archaeon]
MISIGGSVLLSDEADVNFLVNFAKLLVKHSEKYRIFLIVGGGRISRYYIKKGRELNIKEDELDKLGIAITRVNASLITNLLKISNNEIPSNTDDALKLRNKIVVMGGTIPGHSTDFVGAELAKKTHSSKFIIATNVDGIYDKDPNKYSDAKQLKSVSIKDLIKQYGTNWNSAGSNVVVDGPALKMILDAETPTVVINGKKLDQLEKAILNKPINGTIIKI